ncbi:S-adenosylmethionine decarboxylase proenzyme [bioreactor metagenome]|uniref:S-adenosylmethionine decarboxylase proenzyme n=1 Tax=bioreactor metagenome TaxID=1076179 RepID=A0A645CJK9_9ZZZZ
MADAMKKPTPVNLFPDLALGRHLTAEYYDCDAAILADTNRMRDIFTEAALVSGASVLESSFHAFYPQGVSGIVVISESHFAVHAWPEHDYAAVDIFTCGDRIDFQLAMDFLRRELKSAPAVVSHAMSRGRVGADGTLVHETGSRAIPEGVTSWHQRYQCADAWGMQATICIHDCPPELFSCDTMNTLTEGLAERLNSGPEGICRCIAFHDPVKGDGLRMGRMLRDGTITGCAIINRRNFYCDIATSCFFDPREMAEYLMETLRGSYYRLQVALRQ